MMPSIARDWLVSADGYGPPGAGLPDALAIVLVTKLLMAVAWLAILILLVVLAAKRRDLLTRQAYLVAGLVFALSAAAPLLFVASLWLPVGDLAILAEAAGGLVLAFAAIALWRILPQTLTMPSRTVLHAANARLEAEIGERIAAQAALSALNAELEQRVAARTAELTRSNTELLAEIAEKHDLATELARARDQAEGANRVKSMFLASMSHDLRTPLNAIIGFSEMILQEVRGPIGHPKYHSYIGDIHRSGHLLLSLINNILDLSKIEAGKHQLELELVDGKRIAEECVALVAGQTGFDQIEPNLTIQGDGRIYADELALQQIMLNLIGNAAKFTPAGGQIAITLARTPDGGSTLAITDTGIGMDEKGIRKALEPFGQATLTARPRGSGSGLGLTIVTRLVEAHGGRFAIDSAPGYGTTVRIWLPGQPVERSSEQALLRLAEASSDADHQDFVVK
jgi:signal transduction histidine kinase